VLDTNTIISGLLWDGNEATLLRKAEQGAITICTSQDIMIEVASVLQRAKFSDAISRTNITQAMLLAKVILLSDVITPNITIHECRDPEDNKFLECAQAADADYIVSGDTDLLSLQAYHGIPIITTGKALTLLQ